MASPLGSTRTNPFTIDVEDSDTLAILKRLIIDKMGDHQALHKAPEIHYKNEPLLDDHKTLAQYGITHGTTLGCMFSKS